MHDIYQAVGRLAAPSRPLQLIVGTVSLVLHSAAGALALAPSPVESVLEEQVVEVEVSRAPEPSPPQPPPPTPPPPPEKVDPAPTKSPGSPPPPPQEATKVLTRAESPDEPEDLTDRGIANGNSERLNTGQVSATGTGSSPTMIAAPTSVAKTGTPAGPVGEDRSRPAGLLGARAWDDCPFPAEANAAQVNQASVTLTVTVAADGRPSSVVVLKDPGYGFGAAAKTCALARRYSAALNAAGEPMVSTMPPFRITFRR